MSDYRRQQAYEAGQNAGQKGLSEAACTRQRGTIYFDDWHDGYQEGQRTADAAKRAVK